MQYEKITTSIVESFSQKDIALPQNFISLLYYLGLLTFSGKKESMLPILTIPNQTIRTMFYEYFQETIKSSGGFHIDPLMILNLMNQMAYYGHYKDAIQTLALIIKNNTSIQDLVGEEKVAQTFFLAYFLISDLYINKNKPEYQKGYADLTLIPFLGKYTDIPYAYLIEFKYLKTKTPLKKEHENIQKAVEEDRKQLFQYEQSLHLQKDLMKIKSQKVTLKKIVVVFKSAELKYCEEI